VKALRDVTWIKPETRSRDHISGISHRRITAAPVFYRLRSDKSHKECVVRPRRTGRSGAARGPSNSRAALKRDRHPSETSCRVVRRIVPNASVHQSQQSLFPGEASPSADLSIITTAIADLIIPPPVDRTLRSSAIPTASITINLPERKPRTKYRIGCASNHIFSEHN